VVIENGKRSLCELVFITTGHLDAMLDVTLRLRERQRLQQVIRRNAQRKELGRYPGQHVYMIPIDQARIYLHFLADRNLT
jgi:hypothetical protein